MKTTSSSTTTLEAPQDSHKSRAQNGKPVAQNGVVHDVGMNGVHSGGQSSSGSSPSIQEVWWHWIYDVMSADLLLILCDL